MLMPPIPIQRYLVPDGMPSLPDGYTRIDETIIDGLPHRIQLAQNTVLIVVMPTGLAITWRDADPTTVVSQSNDEVDPMAPQEVIGYRPPLRIIVRRADAPFVSFPLVAGLRRIVWDSGRSDRGGQLELLILSWNIRAGNLRGPGDFGSRISLGWSQADQAVMHYLTPPINQVLKPRLQTEMRMQSTQGPAYDLEPQQLRHKRR